MTEKTCPHCHAPIPATAPEGLCPACILRDAERSDASGHAAPSLAEIAAAFPQLTLARLIGHGGMGFVYQAEQPLLDRQVALKILAPELGRDPAFAERFAREARVLGKLNHPNIVSVFEHGERAGLFYLMMEYVDGVNLRQAMAAGGFTPEQALAIVPEICDALQAAHAEGIWHRDIKPENILLDRDGHVKIVDFGIARIVGDPVRNFTLTRTGGWLGSAAYMAPEQHEKPHLVDHRADIYSLGVVIYELLTGELPLGRFPSPSRRAAVNGRIDEIVLRALEKERELRQQSAAEVKTEVLGAAAGSSVPSGSVPAAGEPAFPFLWPTALITGGIFLCLAAMGFSGRQEFFAIAISIIGRIGVVLGVIFTMATIHRLKPVAWIAMGGVMVSVAVAVLIALGLLNPPMILGLLVSTMVAWGWGAVQTRKPGRKINLGDNSSPPQTRAEAATSLGRWALAVLVVGLLGVPLLSGFLGGAELLAFSGAAWISALVLGLFGWRERFGKGVVGVTMAVGLLAAILFVRLRQQNALAIADARNAARLTLEPLSPADPDTVKKRSPHAAAESADTAGKAMQRLIAAACNHDLPAFRSGLAKAALAELTAKGRVGDTGGFDKVRVVEERLVHAGEALVVVEALDESKRRFTFRLILEDRTWKLSGKAS